ncbi:uncharacterized protein ACA1_036370 [Acanthamoeba castellanii str. Neff]|uniref:Uncharacterized protein n=1 Tax=Acanthamoeba castellanii (strain ATCC 30010 / Neff) TaxID=1257118 RepID=L8HDW0_ACACF|nr:uncharacterized protein ACA1_036370 [Acanthamoeba castellanii str. Neff]ELR22948.1 hypothetical protein ACA1_036370 [Acanthamoeba castellanii str. Neff]
MLPGFGGISASDIPDQIQNGYFCLLGRRRAKASVKSVAEACLVTSRMKMLDQSVALFNPRLAGVPEQVFAVKPEAKDQLYLRKSYMYRLGIKTPQVVAYESNIKLGPNRKNESDERRKQKSEGQPVKI